MKGKFIKHPNVWAYMKKQNPKLKITEGFMRYIDMHIESVLKRAAATKTTDYLNATVALMACRYPYHVMTSKLDYRP